ncbi:MAG: glutamate synthase, partial [Nitrospina sp.]
MYISSSHAEAPERVTRYNISTKKFTGENGRVKQIHAVKIQFGDPDPETGRRPMEEIPGSEFTLDVDLVLLAMGFVHPVHEGLVKEFGLDLDERGNVACDAKKMTSVDGVYVAGDMTRGQSLVVWAIAEGREAARSVDESLMGYTFLPHSEFL